VLDENGNEIECEVICLFSCDETGKDYIIYTDNSVDEDGDTRVFASIYDPEVSNSKMMPIETEKEWAMIEAVLEELQSAAEDEELDEDFDEDFDEDEEDVTFSEEERAFLEVLLRRRGLDPDLLSGVDSDILFSDDEDEDIDEEQAHALLKALFEDHDPDLDLLSGEDEEDEDE